MRALAAVLLIGPCTSRELEQHLGVRKSAVHKYLVKLRSFGLIVGEKGSEAVSHRPPYWFRVTDSGMDVLEEIERRAMTESHHRLLKLAETRRG